MKTVPWLPKGFSFGEGSTELKLEGDDQFQVYRLSDGGRLLVADEHLAKSWTDEGLVGEGQIEFKAFGNRRLAFISSGSQSILSSNSRLARPRDMDEALSLASALKLTRQRTKRPLNTYVFVERFSVLLPLAPAEGELFSDDVVLGAYLTGGVLVSCFSERRLAPLTPDFTQAQVAKIIHAAGLEAPTPAANATTAKPDQFALPGRSELEQFFQEHVIDIIKNRERYAKLGIGFPGGVILHGPPGTGKTFAVNKLSAFLDWPTFYIDAGSIGSKYIHETSRKIAEVFQEAGEHSPSIVIIDEMDAFLAQRDSAHEHKIEEISQFLRDLQESATKDILVVGLTNRYDALDPAAIRSGRFDHHIYVGYPGVEEVMGVLSGLLQEKPVDPSLSLEPIAQRLTGRPLSDVALVVKEAARLTAKVGGESMSSESFEQALANLPSRDDAANARKIGFAT